MTPRLGMGVYSLSEVARLAELAPSTARSWFRGRSGGGGRGPVLRSDFDQSDGDFAVSFLDLVDCYVAGRFRRAGVSMPTVRAAHSELGRDLRTHHPFAHSCLFTDGKRILVRAAGRVQDQVLYDALSKQLFFNELTDDLERIDYDPRNLLAARWRRTEGVLIDPRINFGKPVVGHTGTSTLVLARQYLANQKNAKLVADLFDISEADVENAIEFESRFGRLAA